MSAGGEGSSNLKNPTPPYRANLRGWGLPPNQDNWPHVCYKEEQERGTHDSNGSLEEVSFI